MAHASTGSTGSVGSSGDLDDYLAEIQDIEQGTNPEEAPEEEPKTPDEGENEVAWLKDTGFAHLASNYEEGRMLEADIVLSETASLTKPQAEAVKKRIETLNNTIRKRSKHHPKQDVRKVFTASGHQFGNSSSSSPPHDKSLARPRESFSRKAGAYSVAGGGAKASQESQNIEGLSIHAKEEHTKQSKRHARPPPYHEPPVDYESPDYVDPGTITSFMKPTHEPEVGSVTSKHGQTHVEDLGKADLVRLRQLALLELSNIYDIHQVTYNRKKAKRRYFNEHGIYGVPLQTLLDHDQKKHRHLKVPLFYKQLMEFLSKRGIDEEGILRVPGSATRIKSLRQKIEEKFNSDKFSWDDIPANDAAGLLKQFLRDLPVPLLTFEYVEAFACLNKIEKKEQKMQALNYLILQLPDVHRNTLKLLLEFLKEVSDYGANRMTMSSVAMIMAPNLFLVQSRRNKSKGRIELELAMATSTASIVRLMIERQDDAWKVPAEMMVQVRQQYDAEQGKKSRDKSIMKLLGRKDKSDAYRKPNVNNEADLNNQVIQVKSSVRGKSKNSVEIKLSKTSTAGEVVSWYQRLSVGAPPTPEMNGGRESRDSSGDELESCSSLPEITLENTYLYEVGGNIGERRLAHDTNVLAVYKTNPNTEWIVKTTKPG